MLRLQLQGSPSQMKQCSCRAGKAVHSNASPGFHTQQQVCRHPATLTCFGEHHVGSCCQLLRMKGMLRMMHMRLQICRLLQICIACLQGQRHGPPQCRI